MDTSIIKKAYDFKTCLFINNGKGKFDIKPLPDEAQMSPVFGIMADDLNRDGIKDIYLAGNLYGLKPELGRYDANFGVVFRGKENHQFEYLAPSKTGLFYRGEVRDVAGIKTADKKKTILLARNNDKLQIFKHK